MATREQYRCKTASNAGRIGHGEDRGEENPDSLLGHSHAGEVEAKGDWTAEQGRRPSSTLLCLGPAAAWSRPLTPFCTTGCFVMQPTPGSVVPLSEDLSVARSPFRSRLPRPPDGCGDRTGAAHRHGCPVVYRTCNPIQSNCGSSADRPNELTRHAGVGRGHTVW